jgi:hypothetical protein
LLLTRLVGETVARFGIDCPRLRSDSTSLTVTGRCTGADERIRGGRQSAAITFGYSEDHRPDLKQLVWIPAVSAHVAAAVGVRATREMKTRGIKQLSLYLKTAAALHLPPPDDSTTRTQTLT